MTEAWHGRTVLRADLAEVRHGRRFVAELCEQAGVPTSAFDSAILLASEAVTNAIIHGRSEATLSVEITDADNGHRGRIHIEVCDDNSRHPHLVEPQERALDGRGLHLIAALSDQWGVRDEAPMGKAVWFDVGYPDCT